MRTTRLGMRTAAALGTLVLAGLLSSAAASANDYTASGLGDSVATVCPPEPTAVNCSVREAIEAAHDNAGADRVILVAGVHALSIPDEGGPNNTGGDLDYDSTAGGALEILGGGATIDASAVPVGNGPRVLELFGAFPVTISNLTVTGGHVPFEGGGIKSDLAGILTLTDVIVSGNTAMGSGGGIDSTGAALKLDHSKILNNISQNAGGGIALRADGGAHIDLITRSAFSGNRTIAPGGVGGGGMAVFGDGAGGVTDPTVTVENSTFDGNKAAGYGGAMDVYLGGSLSLRFSTLTRNRADDDNTMDGLGGGLQNGNGFIGLYANLIANNSVGGGGGGPDCNGAMTSAGYNVITSTAGCSGFGAPGDVTTSSPGIGPLNPPTNTNAAAGSVPLLPGSPAIDRAPADANCPIGDQQGRSRPIPASGLCDSGAFECGAIPSIGVSCYASPAAVLPAAAAPSATPAAKKCKKKKKRKGRSAAVAKKKKKCKKKKRR